MCTGGECWQGDGVNESLEGGKYKPYLGQPTREGNVSVDKKWAWTFQQQLEGDLPAINALLQV